VTPEGVECAAIKVDSAFALTGDARLADRKLLFRFEHDEKFRGF